MSSGSFAVEALIQHLKATVAGMLWTSETDAPFEVEYWSALQVSPTATPTAEQVLQQAQLPPETPVRCIDLETFLAPVLQSHAPASQETTAQFQTLKTVLSQALQQVQVFYCGEVEIEIYILGCTLSCTEDCDWIALHTSAVET